ncbi:hypothetical protein ACOMHN_018665 [Nucella lapillus]
MVFNITASLNELYCQVIHENNGLCNAPSIYRNCSCKTINSTNFYWVRIWVADYRQEKYKLEITFDDEGTRFARGDVTVIDIDSFGGHFHQLNSSGDSSNAEPESETRNNLPSDTTRNGINSSVSNDEHDNSSVTVAVVIVIVAVVKTAFIIAVIAVRRHRRSAMRGPVAPRVGDDQQLRRIPEVNNRRMSQQSDQDCQDYDPLDPDYEPVERYTEAYQGNLTRVCSSDIGRTPSAPQRLKDLEAEVWQWQLKEGPVFATSMGDSSGASKLESFFNTANHSVYDDRRDTVQGFRDRLRRIDKSQLMTDKEKLDYVIFEHFLQTYLDGSEWNSYVVGNPLTPNGLRGYYEPDPSPTTEQQLRDYATRLSKLPQMNYVVVIKQALEVMKEVLVEAYLPAARSTSGVHGWPEGGGFYQQCLQYHTSTNMTAEEIYQLGLREVNRIETSMNEEELVQEVRNTIDRVKSKISGIFQYIPDIPVEVNAVTSDGPIASYQRPTPTPGGGFTSGILNINVNDHTQMMGRYSLEMLQAARLVIDTGLHYKRWDREQAIAYLRDKTGSFSYERAEQEINRYITTPGQATAYKIGEIKIKDLRKKAIAELGENFEEDQFHTLLLANGPMPLSLLDTMVNEWINEKKFFF